MVDRRERLTHVVQERDDHELLIRSAKAGGQEELVRLTAACGVPLLLLLHQKIVEAPRGGLQTVLEQVHTAAESEASLVGEHLDHAIGELVSGRHLCKLRVHQRDVVRCHRGKRRRAGALHHR
eukprot:4100259-Prymnesium_polylepis.1